MPIQSSLIDVRLGPAFNSTPRLLLAGGDTKTTFGWFFIWADITVKQLGLLTCVIDEYAIEGHVPAKEIKRLLAEKPKAVGLAVPAMPLGSPGMDGPEYKGRKDSYDVLLIGLNGKPSVYQSYR